MHPPRPTTRRARGLAALLAGLCWSLAVAAPAVAAPPVDLPAEVTDLADVLDPDQELALAAELDAIAAESPYQLFVVYVDDFDGMDNRAWADATAAASGLGRDDVLLAVAVDARRYQVRVQHDNALTDARLTSVEQDRIEPALRVDDWAGAAVAAAAGYAEPPGETSWLDWLIVLSLTTGVLLLFASPVLVPLLIWLILRRRRKRCAAAELRALEDRSALALVAADEAITRGTQEHAFAEAQFGPVTVEPFTTALVHARDELAEAFRLRRELDDDEPETPDRRRAVAQAVVDGCTRVETMLRKQERAAARLRGTHERAPQDLADAGAEAQRLTLRAQEAARAWSVLGLQHAPSATADVPLSIAAAERAVAEAVAQVAAGTAALEGARAVAVAHAREARAALGRAAAVLDGLDRHESDLAGAPAATVAVLAELDADLADAARLAPDDPEVRSAAAAARRAQDAARGAGPGGDPLAVLTTLRAAERDLDAALDGVRRSEAARLHAVERLPRALDDVRRMVSRAQATFDRAPGVVGAAAQTRLAEAERLADEAAALTATDPAAALGLLRTAADRAERAEFQALRNMDGMLMRARGFDPVLGTQDESRSGSSSSDRAGSSSGGSSGGGGSRGGGGRF